jgi:hypothetical protein
LRLICEIKEVGRTELVYKVNWYQKAEDDENDEDGLNEIIIDHGLQENYERTTGIRTQFGANWVNKQYEDYMSGEFWCQPLLIVNDSRIPLPRSQVLIVEEPEYYQHLPVCVGSQFIEHERCIFNETMFSVLSASSTSNIHNPSSVNSIITTSTSTQFISTSSTMPTSIISTPTVTHIPIAAALPSIISMTTGTLFSSTSITSTPSTRSTVSTITPSISTSNTVVVSTLHSTSTPSNIDINVMIPVTNDLKTHSPSITPIINDKVQILPISIGAGCGVLLLVILSLTFFLFVIVSVVKYKRKKEANVQRGTTRTSTRRLLTNDLYNSVTEGNGIHLESIYELAPNQNSPNILSPITPKMTDHNYEILLTGFNKQTSKISQPPHHYSIIDDRCHVPSELLSKGPRYSTVMDISENNNIYTYAVPFSVGNEYSTLQVQDSSMIGKFDGYNKLNHSVTSVSEDLSSPYNKLAHSYPGPSTSNGQDYFHLSNSFKPENINGSSSFNR